MAGGDATDVDRARPVLETFGNPVLHLGAVGSGQVAKALNNLLFAANLAMASTLFQVAGAMDIDREGLARCVSPSSGRSYAFDVLTSLGFDPSPMAARAGPLLRKDVSIVAELANQASAPLGLLIDAADSALAQLDHSRAAAVEGRR